MTRTGTIRPITTDFRRFSRLSVQTPGIRPESDQELHRKPPQEGFTVVPSNTLTEVKAVVVKRLEELRPAYLEYLELEAYVELTGNFPTATPEAEAEVPQPQATPAPAPAPAKPAATRQRPGSAKKPAAKSKPAASKKPAAKAKPAAAVPTSDGQTEAKVKEIVASHPDGIKVGDIIKEGNLSQSYTYDVVKRLTESKELVKRNRKIYIHENAATTAPKASQAQPVGV